MLTIRCCAQPPKHEGGFKFPKRVSRSHRLAEVRRAETLRDLKTTANDEAEFIEAYFKARDGQRHWWGDDELDAAADEADAEDAEE